MESLLSKISAYHIISYALTGLVIFAIYGTLHSVEIEQNPFLFFGLTYSIGLIFSRIGSLIVEWPLKRLKFVAYADYADFVRAEIEDPKVSGLAEQSAFYRTLATGFLALAMVSMLDDRSPCWLIHNGRLETSLYGLATILFAFSYRKQCKFVVDRIHSHSREKLTL